ncbi:MAG: class I SAM-dependent methyltransferase [Deltaproteobacteria bacterium]|nr:class I SAM-dependent methyltransferase [Deltaproteobacteria bacterium]
MRKSAGCAVSDTARRIVSEDGREEVACDCCGSPDYRVIYPARPSCTGDLAERFRSSGDERLADRLVACRHCGLQYVSPRLTAETILAGYAAGEDPAFVSQTAARERTFRRCLDLLERYWRQPPGRLCDIGTAGGAFLHVARARGWEVSGCEPNRWLCDWGRRQYGLTIHAGDVFALPAAPAAFDVLTLWDVLEHTASPRAVLARCHEFLRPGGLVAVNYPDIGSLVARAMGRRWVFLLSVHLYYFTRRTIARLLHDTGFTIVGFRPHLQTLELGYICRRMSAYLRTLGRAGGWTAKRLGIAHRPVPYWMGQTLVIARRR